MVELIVWLLHMEQMNPVGVANQLKLLNSDTTEFCATRHLLGGDSLSPKKVGNLSNTYIRCAWFFLVWFSLNYEFFDAMFKLEDKLNHNMTYELINGSLVSL